MQIICIFKIKFKRVRYKTQTHKRKIMLEIKACLCLLFICCKQMKALKRTTTTLSDRWMGIPWDLISIVPLEMQAYQLQTDQSNNFNSSILRKGNVKGKANTTPLFYCICKISNYLRLFSHTYCLISINHTCS